MPESQSLTQQFRSPVEAQQLQQVLGYPNTEIRRAEWTNLTDGAEEGQTGLMRAAIGDYRSS